MGTVIPRVSYDFTVHLQLVDSHYCTQCGHPSTVLPCGPHFLWEQKPVENWAGALRWGFSGTGFPRFLLEVPARCWPGLWTCARPYRLPWSRAQRCLSGSGKLLDFLVASTLARKRNPSPAPPARPDGTLSAGIRTRTTHPRLPAALESQPGSQAAIDNDLLVGHPPALLCSYYVPVNHGERVGGDRPR